MLNAIRRQTLRDHRKILAVCRYLLIPIAIYVSHISAKAQSPTNKEFHRVIVYYANDTPERALVSDNYGKLLDALKRRNTPLTTFVAEALLRDGHEFPEMVKRNVDALSVAARANKLDLFVFTNTLALDGRYLGQTESSGNVARGYALPSIPQSTTPVLQTSPLSRPDQLKKALEVVRQAYAVNSALEVILIVHSHGTPDLALSPRVNVDLSIASPEELLNQLEKNDTGEPSPVWASAHGTAKHEFWDIIASFSADGTRFPLIFLEACQSAPYSFADSWAIPSAVGEVVHSGVVSFDDKKITFSEVSVADGSTWPAALAARLSRAGLEVDGRLTILRWPVYIVLQRTPTGVFFLPLTAWVLWLAMPMVCGRFLRMRASAAMSRPKP